MRAADQPQVDQVGGPAALGAEHDPSRAGVAGDDVRQGETAVAVPGVVDIHRGEDGLWLRPARW